MKRSFLAENLIKDLTMYMEDCILQEPLCERHKEAIRVKVNFWIMHESPQNLKTASRILEHWPR